MVKWILFIDRCFLDLLQEEEKKTGASTPTRLKKQIDQAVGGWKTSSSQFNEVTGKIRTTGKTSIIWLPTLDKSL